MTDSDAGCCGTMTFGCGCVVIILLALTVAILMGIFIKM